jgi:AcrR family transcriptional regulator
VDTTDRDQPSAPGRGERSRQAILDAAEELLAGEGYAGMSIARLEQASGLPASSIYWHFGNKEGVALAVMERGAERFLSTYEQVEHTQGTPIERVRAILDYSAEQTINHPLFLRLLISMSFQQGANEQTRAVIERVRARGLELSKETALLIADAVGQDINDTTADAIGRLMMSVADGLVLAHHLGEPIDIHALFERVAPMLMAIAQTEGQPQRRPRAA